MPAEPPIRALRVHLGAHKTATTHLQKALHKHRAALRAADIDFIRPVQLRAALAAGEGRLRLPWRERPGSGRRSTASAPAPSTLAISEENLPGQIRDLFDDSSLPQPRDARRAARPPRRRYPPGALPLDPPVRPPLALGPRRGAAPPRPRPRPHRPLRRIARRRPPSWTDVVARLQRACPRATIRVWRYEDHEPHWRALAAAFVGADTGAIASVSRPKGSMSPSRRGRPAGRGGHRPGAAGRGRGRSTPPTRRPRATPTRPSTPRRWRRCSRRYDEDVAALRARGQLMVFD